MKKIIIFISLFISFIGSSYAFNLDFTSDMSTFRRGLGITEISPIIVNITNDNDIIKDKGFSLIIPDQSALRFYQYQSVTITGSPKVNSGVIVLPSMKTLKFSVNADMKIGDSFVITGLKIFIPRTGTVETRQIGLDNNQGQINYTSLSIRINDITPLSDYFPPSEVFNLTGSISGGNLILSGDNPGDSDFSNIQVLLLDKNKNIISTNTVQLLDKYSLAIGNADYVQVKTTNFHSDVSPGLLFPISYFDNNINISVSNTGATSTGTSINNTGTIISNTGTVDVILLPKYLPVFNKYITTLNRFISTMDQYISFRLDPNTSVYFQNQVITIRNNIAKISEELDKSNLQNRNDIMIRLKSSVDSLKFKLTK